MKAQAAYDVQHCALNMRIDPVRKYISGTATIEVEVRYPLAWLVLDLNAGLQVNRVVISSSQDLCSGSEAGFDHRGSKLWVSLLQVLPPGARVVAVID